VRATAPLPFPAPCPSLPTGVGCPSGPMSGCVLAIDLGTGGPKVALVTADGATLGWRNRPVTTRRVDHDGYEQDPDEMWWAIIAAAREVLAEVAHPAVVAVAVTSQYMSTIPVRSDGHPTGPCILWMDTRGAPHSQSLLTDESFGLFVERHGLIPLPSGNDNLAHAHVLETRHPDAFAAADALVEPMDYVVGRLTGHVSVTQSTAFGQIVCDNRVWDHAEYDPALVAAGRLEPSKLAPLRSMRGPAGELSTAVAHELGLPSGVPVMPGSIDSITSAVGSGAVSADRAAFVLGTTAVMVTHVDSFCGNVLSLPTVPSPVPGRWYVMAENGLGGRALEWAQGMFGFASAADAIAAAAEVDPGSEGLVFLPWLLGSIAPSPNDDVRAAFVGLGLGHDRRHAVRSVLEGVALNLAWMLPVVEEFTGHRYERLAFGGGGALSSLWGQVLADATGRRVERLAEPRATNARGAAFLAFCELGLLDLDDVAGLLRVDETHEPDSRHRGVMDQALETLTTLHPQLSLLAARPRP
jgi:xylulokinase